MHSSQISHCPNNRGHERWVGPWATAAPQPAGPRVALSRRELGLAGYLLRAGVQPQNGTGRGAFRVERQVFGKIRCRGLRRIYRACPVLGHRRHGCLASYLIPKSTDRPILHSRRFAHCRFAAICPPLRQPGIRGYCRPADCGRGEAWTRRPSSNASAGCTRP